MSKNKHYRNVCILFLLTSIIWLLGYKDKLQEVRNKKKYCYQSRQTVQDYSILRSFCYSVAAHPRPISACQHNPLYFLFHEQGSEIASDPQQLTFKNPHIISLLERIDQIGTGICQSKKALSQASLYCLHQLRAVDSLIGEKKPQEVVQIGAGTGLLAASLCAHINTITRYTIVDTAAKLALAKSCLSSLQKHFPNLSLPIDYMTVEELTATSCDLLISDEGLSSFDRSIQSRCMNLLIPRATQGYIVYRHLEKRHRVRSFDRVELLHKLQRHHPCARQHTFDSLTTAMIWSS